MPPEVEFAIARDLPLLRPARWARALNIVFVCGAGVTAEARYLHADLLWLWLSPFGQGDFDQAMRTLLPFVPDKDERSRVVYSVWEGTTRQVTRSRHWNAVSDVAELLLRERTLDGNVVTDIVRGLLPHLPTSPIVEAIFHYPMPLGDAPIYDHDYDRRHGTVVSARKDG